MKRIKIILPLAIVLLFGIALMALLRWNSGGAPRFVPASTAEFGTVNMTYRDPVVHFADNMVWGTGTRRAGSNENPLLFDIEKRAVVGELLNAEPELLNGDGTKLLCRQTTRSLKAKLGAFIAQVSRGRIDRQWQNYNTVNMWVLDLKHGSAKRIGRYSEWWRFDSVFAPSPGFRHAYKEPADTGELFVCDLDNERTREFVVAGQPQGWWDGQNVLLQDNTKNLLLLDVATGATNTLFSVYDIARSLRDFGLTNNATDLNVFQNWNGRGYDFYFIGETYNFSMDAESFLIKLDHTGPSLRLVYRKYRPRPGGVFDASATHCLCVRVQSPRNPTEAILLRDLRDNTEVTIDQRGIGSYFAPRFYRDGVLYYSGDALWRSDLNGSNHVRLLPTPGK